MSNSNFRRVFSPILLENLEQRLVPASSVFSDQVTNTFRFALNRSPEESGLRAFVANLDAGQSLNQVTEAIFQSEEHQRAVITCYYRELLNREPDTEGMNAFLGAVKNGATPEEILAGFLSSKEYIGRDVSDEGYVDFLYQQILERSADEQGKAAHLNALKNGASRFDVALGFLTSRENDSVEVQSFYREILGRSGSASEVKAWTDLLARPDVDQQDVLVNFLSSTEGAERLGSGIVFGTDTKNEGWWLDQAGLVGLTMEPFGGPTSGQAQIQFLANQIRAVETFSNPDNMGQIVSQLRSNDYPDPNAKNNAARTTTGTFGASAYPGDLRNTPGAFQVDLANMGKVDPWNKNFEVFGRWDGTAGALKNPNSPDVEFDFSKDTLSTFLGIELDANGLITSITREAASVFLHNEAVAFDAGFDPLKNPLIGQHIDTLKREQLSLYLAGRVAEDSTVGLDDPRVAPDGVVSTALGLQYQTSRSYMYGVLKTYASNDTYKEIFAKAKDLFGSTMRITSSQTAFGVNKGDVFWSKFNAAFISGGAYVSGVNAMYGLYSGLAQANETGTGTWVTGSSTITFKKVADGATAADKIFTVDKTPLNLSETYPSIFHYGAVMSTIAIDDLLNDPDSWGVTGRTGEMGYNSIGATQLQQGGGTLASGASAYYYIYDGLDANQTLKMVGTGAYRLAPVPTASADVVRVDNSGYSQSSNNSQSVTAGKKIDMSAYGLTIEQAYPDMFFVDTTVNPAKVYRVSDKDFVAPAAGLYLYYVNGAGGDLDVATDAITNYKVSWQEPYKFSYRVSVANTDILGRPDNAQQFGQQFIMTPPPPPVQGTGVIDANGLTGNLWLQTNTSITRVLLGSGPNRVDAGSQGTGVQYVLNSGIQAGVASTVFSGLRFGTDKVDLTSFGAVTNLVGKVIGSFDNKVGNSQTASLYPQYTDTVEVSFSAGGNSYKFLVLNSGKTRAVESALITSVLSSIQS